MPSSPPTPRSLSFCPQNDELHLAVLTWGGAPYGGCEWWHRALFSGGQIRWKQACLGSCLVSGWKSCVTARRDTDGKIRQAPDIADETTGKIHFDNTSAFTASTLTPTRATRPCPSRIRFWCYFRATAYVLLSKIWRFNFDHLTSLLLTPTWMSQLVNHSTKHSTVIFSPYQCTRK